MTRAGICGTRTEVSPGERRNLNSLFITMRTRHMRRIPLRMGVLNLAHEVLHSLGAEHDPATVECGARYIMSKYSGSGKRFISYITIPVFFTAITTLKELILK